VGQVGFYDLDSRLKALSAKGDPLEALEALVPFESFRADIEAVARLAPEERKSNAGRKPFDAVMMFKILVLQTLYNLADEQVEYQVRDRLSFMRFGTWAGRCRAGQPELKSMHSPRFPGSVRREAGSEGYDARAGRPSRP
jgi:hypothetical protein